MVEIILNIENKTVLFTVKKILNLGRTARDPIEVRKHLMEMNKDILEDSIEMPTYNPKIKDRITTNSEIEVLSNSKTSGEVEPVLLFNDDLEIFVTVGSDHTDREIGKIDRVLGKNIYPNIISPNIWRYEEIKEHWDDLIMRSWIKKDDQRKLYQEGSLKSLLRPEQLLEKLKSKIFGDLRGAIILCGTFPTLGGKLCHSSYFEMELIDEKMKRCINHFYEIKPIQWYIK